MPSNQGSKKKEKIIIGITGGIGSGKSIVCDILKSFGCEIFYADEIAKKLYEQNLSLKTSLYKNFERNIFENGELSRIKFKNFLIKNKVNQIRVNKIVHPFVINEILKLADKSKNKLIFIEAALIFESGFDKYLDLVILVSSKVKFRINRIKKRDKLSLAKIRAIINLQMPENNKKERADIIVENNGGLTKLKNNVTFIYELLKKLY